MRQSLIRVVLSLVFVGLLSTACGGTNSTVPSEANRVATRVAEELAVAATLTALVPSGEEPVAPAATEVVAAATVPSTQAVEPTQAQSAAETPSPAAATQAPAPTIGPTNPPPAASCLVITAGLNLRPGPGTVYSPPLGALARNTELRPLSFVARGFPSGQWIEVQVASNGQQGWVGAGQQFVACNVDLASLPAGVPPPTPAPTSAVLSVPSPIPASQVVVVPVDGSDGNQALGNDRGVKSGRNLLLPGVAPYQVTEPMVFRDRIVFRVEIFDRDVGKTDGAGIESVTFTIRDETGAIVHERTERTPGYCVFGGGEPECTVWRFTEHGNQWPGGANLHPGVHDAQIGIKPKNGDAVTWFWSFRIEK